MKLKGRRHSNRAVDHTVAKVTLPSQSRLKIKLENPYTIQGPIWFESESPYSYWVQFVSKRTPPIITYLRIFRTLITSFCKVKGEQMGKHWRLPNYVYNARLTRRGESNER